MNGLIDTIKHSLGMKDSIDIDVEICPAHRRDELMESNETTDEGRWLYAGTPSGSETIWLLKGERDEPYTDDAKERRVYDAICHETMHAVISFVEDEKTSDQYDEMIREVLPVTTYLHRYAQFSEIEEEVARMDEQEGSQ
jgi:hypothetical protein